MAREEACELFERLRPAVLGAQRRRRFGREVHEGQGASNRLDLDRRERDARMARERGNCHVRRYEGLGRRQERALAIMAPLFMAELDIGPVGGERRLEPDEVDDYAARWQVVRESHRVAEKERQPGLDAGRYLAGRHGAIHAARLRIALEALAPAAAEGRDRFGRRRDLARREERHRRQPFAGSLIRRIECTHGFDQVVEQVEPVRLLRAGRINIHDRAPHGELARTQYLCHLRVSGVYQALAQARQVDTLAGRQCEGMRGDERPGREAIQHRCLGRDDDALAECRQGGKCREPFRDDVRVRREGIVGQGLAVGKRPELESRACEEAQFREVLLGLAAAAADDHERCAVLRGGPGEVIRGTAAIQLAPAKGFSSLGQSRWRRFAFRHKRSCKQYTPFRAVPGGVLRAGYLRRGAVAQPAGAPLTSTECRTRSFSKYTENCG